MVETDASKYAYGAVLSQLEDGTWKPLAFMSRTMQPAEVNYNVHDKELLAIIKALEEWEQYLPHFGSTPTIIISDHQNLQYFVAARQVKPRHIRWKEFLSGFNVKITYHPGKSSTKPDALSRRPDHEVNEPPKEEVILEPSLFADPSILTSINTMVYVQDASLPAEIGRDQLKDPVIAGFLLLKESDDQGIPQGWERNDDRFWTMNGKIYVAERTRHKVLQAYHDSKTAGHPGIS